MPRFKHGLMLSYRQSLQWLELQGLRASSMGYIAAHFIKGRTYYEWCDLLALTLGTEAPRIVSPWLLLSKAQRHRHKDMKPSDLSSCEAIQRIDDEYTGTVSDRCRTEPDR